MADLNEHGDRTLDIDGGRRIQCTRKHIPNRRSQFDIQYLDFQGEIGEAEPQHLRNWIFDHLSIKTSFSPQIEVWRAYLYVVTEFRKQVEAKPMLDSACTTTPLGGIAFSYEGFYKATNLPLLVESLRENVLRGTLRSRK